MVIKEEYPEIKEAPLTLKNFVKKYHTSNQSDDWNDNTIEKRSSDLALEAENITWKFKQKITDS